jgi:hypothetical protein
MLLIIHLVELELTRCHTPEAPRRQAPLLDLRTERWFAGRVLSRPGTAVSRAPYVTLLPPSPSE